MLSSSLVQSGGIQAQFNQVNREKEKLRSEKEAFERERLLVEKELQALTAAHEDYTAKIRTAQGKAGRVNAQRSMRQNELHQLTQQKKEERRALEDTAQEVKNCEDQERQRMIDFCQEVNKLTDNFDHLIRQLEGARLMTLICPESVDRLLAIWKEKRSDVLDNAEQIDAKLTNAAKAFKESIEKWNEAHTYNEHLQQQLFAVRQEALSSGKVSLGKPTYRGI